VRVALGEGTKVEAVLLAVPGVVMKRGTLRPYIWATLAVGAAGVIAGGALAGAAKSKESSVQGASGEFSNVSGDDALGRRMSAAAVAMLVVGGVGLGTAGLLFLLDRRGGSPAPAERPAAGAERSFYASPTAGPGLVGVTAGGRF
jgi:hypothetical protein